ncbi:hypothetical protein AcV7_001556 [Taiwanofungus camphoratus]|nr:hypothetical protein AcV7_001556 [Antrodia cinnamomea]
MSYNYRSSTTHPAYSDSTGNDQAYTYGFDMNHLPGNRPHLAPSVHSQSSMLYQPQGYATSGLQPVQQQSVPQYYQSTAGGYVAGFNTAPAASSTPSAFYPSSPVHHSSIGYSHPAPSYSQPPPRTSTLAYPPQRTPCLWDGGSCGVTLDDVSAAGIIRHLKAYHFDHVTNPWGNRKRGRCRWDTYCRSEEMNYESLGKHIAEVHLGSTAQICPYCRGRFARADTLARHLRENCDGY